MQSYGLSPALYPLILLDKVECRYGARLNFPVTEGAVTSAEENFYAFSLWLQAAHWSQHAASQGKQD